MPAPAPASTSTEAKPSATSGDAVPDLAQLWESMHELSHQSAAAQFIVESMTPTSIRSAGGVLIVCVNSTIGSLGPPTPAQIAKVEALLTRAAGRPAKIEAPKVAAASKPAAAPPPPSSDAAARSQAVNHPLVKRAMELFDARLVRVDKPSQD